MPHMPETRNPRKPDHAELHAWAAGRPGWRRRGREWCGPCPACGGTDRCRVNDRGIFCRNHCALPDMLAAGGLRARHDSAWDRDRPRAAAKPPTRAPDPAEAGAIRRAALMRSASEADAFPCRHYLAHRGCWPSNRTLPEIVRWLPAQRPEAPPGMPPDAAGCVVYAFGAGFVQADALTGAWVPTPQRWRRSFGRQQGAMFHVPGPPDRPLAVCEGPADALAIRTWLGTEAVALGGTAGFGNPAIRAALRRMGSMRAPGAAQIVVHRDSGAPGLAAGQALADWLRSCGVACFLEDYRDDPAADLAAMNFGDWK